MSKKKADGRRVDAILQLKKAQKMLQDGKAQLGMAQQQIDKAQKLIDESAQVLREGWPDQAH